MLALQTLVASASPQDRRDYEWDIAGLQAKRRPVALPPAALDAFVGTYGIRRIWREGATLMFQREQREATVMIPMGNDLFGLANSPNVRIQFRRNGGRIVGFDQIGKDGILGSIERTS